MMEPVASKAPELPWQEQEAAELRAELHMMKTAGIIEVAVRNPSVAEYMAHWEARATDAEARIKELEAALDEKEIASGLTSDGNLWRYWAAKAKDLALKNADLTRERDDAEALLKEARDKALEEAAKVAEATHEEAPEDEQLGDEFWALRVSCNTRSTQIARKIRALKEKP